MGNLFISFTVAISGAIGLVVLSGIFDLEFYTNKILPLIPILYAITYEFLERRKRGKAKAAQTFIEKEKAKKSEAVINESLTVGRVITDVGICFIAKFSIEMLLVALFLRFSGQSFTEIYGGFGIETVGRFLRGEHPWFAGTEGVYLLALIALLTCFITGLWIGHTSKGKAMLEGVLAGAAITVFMAMTNMLILYRKIEEVTVHLADALGYVLRAGFLVVITLQVLLYGLWSGLVQMEREDRDYQAASQLSRRASRKWFFQ